MSALCGIFHLDGSPVVQDDLDKMMQAISHRGIDGSGSWVQGQVGLGHQIFWITPESLTETLPRYDPVAQLAITAVARLDNREDLFQTASGLSGQ
jgi:asparagine synthase (glutamine-hydrolysing)